MVDLPFRSQTMVIACQWSFDAFWKTKDTPNPLPMLGKNKALGKNVADFVNS